MKTLGLVLLAFAGGTNAFAVDDIPEIVVTAQLRDTTLENVPSSAVSYTHLTLPTSDLV